MEYNKRIISKIEEYCLSKPGAYETRPFGKNPVCYRVMGKIFAQFYEKETFYKITLKCDSEAADFYRQSYPNIVVRGYHCPPVQWPYWNTVDLVTFSDWEILLKMIEESYDAVMGKLNKKAKTQLLALSELEYIDTDGQDPDFAMLCQKLDCALNELVGNNIQRVQYDQYNQRDSIHDVIVVYQNGKPVACGAFKMYDKEHAELKRIYTEPQIRKNGLGTELIRRLEAKAKMKGYQWCILETGKPLEAACHMYKKAGYKIIPNYGQYADMPASICMKRRI